MAPWEVESLRFRLFEELDRVVKALDGLDEAAVNWKPPSPSANTLLVLATHTLGAGRVTDALARMDPAVLEVMHDTPAGKLAGGHWLVHAVAHAAEHAGQMELTRDLWLATKERR